MQPETTFNDRFWTQACELFEAGQFELAVVAAELHLQAHLRALPSAAQKAARARLELHRYVECLPDGTRSLYAAHLERFHGVLSRGQTVDGTEALDALAAIEELVARTSSPLPLS